MRKQKTRHPPKIDQISFFFTFWRRVIGILHFSGCLKSMVSRQFLRRPDQEDALRLRRQKDAEEDAMLREERQRRRQQEAA